MRPNRLKSHVRYRLKDESPAVHIGKVGLTTQVLAEIDKQLEQKKMLKIRILTSAMQQDNAKTIAARVAEQTNAILVEVRGHIFMLYRRHKN